MTRKKYEIVFLNGLDGLCSIQDTETEIPTFYNDLGYINHVKPVCDLLNEQDERIQELEKEKEEYKRILLDFGVRTVFKENTVLRDGDVE